MGKINVEWHQAHVLGSGADMDSRVEWHLEHVNNCSCRGMPDTVLAEVRRRGLTDRLPAGYLDNPRR